MSFLFHALARQSNSMALSTQAWTILACVFFVQYGSFQLLLDPLSLSFVLGPRCSPSNIRAFLFFLPWCLQKSSPPCCCYFSPQILPLFPLSWVLLIAFPSLLPGGWYRRRTEMNWNHDPGPQNWTSPTVSLGVCCPEYSATVFPPLCSLLMISLFSFFLPHPLQHGDRC